MIFVKVIGLFLLSAYGLSMGRFNDLNGFGIFAFGLSLATTPWLYLLPSIEAYHHDKPNAQSIALVNVLLGWTLIGWVFALVWSLQESKHIELMADTRTCPHCAETVKAAAKVCKHCHGELSTPVAVSG